MGKFIIRRVASGVKFDLLAANGQCVATSEVYRTEAACRKGIQSVQACAAAKIHDLTEDTGAVSNPKFEIYLDKSGAYRFRLRSRNGKIIAVSEGYTTKAACRSGIDSVRANAL